MKLRGASLLHRSCHVEKRAPLAQLTVHVGNCLHSPAQCRKGSTESYLEKAKPMLYTIALFTHIVGVNGIFTVATLELASLFGLHRARLMEEVRGWARLHQV